MRRDDVATMGGLPRPGRALWGVILTLFAIWRIVVGTLGLIGLMIFG